MPAADRPSLAEQVFGKERCEELRKRARVNSSLLAYWHETGLKPEVEQPPPRDTSDAADARWFAELLQRHAEVLRPVLLELLADDIGEMAACLAKGKTR